MIERIQKFQSVFFACLLFKSSSVSISPVVTWAPHFLQSPLPRIGRLLNMDASTFTPTIRKKPYAAISFSKPSVSRVGRTVLITDGRQGVRYAIARSFVKASASTVVIIARRYNVGLAALSKLKEEVPVYDGRLVCRECDVSDLVSTAALWEHLDKEKIVVDTAVLNPARFTASRGLLDSDL